MAQLKSTWYEKVKRVVGSCIADRLWIDGLTYRLHEPRDPASLAIWRIVFGLLIIIDIPQERGMARISSRWGDPNQCNFPLFSFLTPLPVDWMYVVYLLMLLGALGLAAGFQYRLSCLTFVLTYWYIYLLDKSVWNNHSYLYGLIGFQFLFIDANRCWSVDGLFNHSIRNCHVPLWNYTFVQFQIFLVYFIAGLKKLDKDWITGYSMDNLAINAVFDPFRLLLTNDQIDLYIVHIGGLMLDLFIGFLLFIDKTRPVAIFFCTMFHTMNSQMFQIGMFPYAMLLSIPIFCYPDWPRNIFKHFPNAVKMILALDSPVKRSEHCLYRQPDSNLSQEYIKKLGPVSEKMPLQKANPTRKSKQDAKHKKNEGLSEKKIGLKNRVVVVALLTYAVSQMLLPYSHFITKGYNNWTDGLYGYSWDMMVHSWTSQHIQITYVDNSTGEIGYITPGVHLWEGASERWSAHGDMLKQYAMCLSNHLKQHNIQNVQLFFDVWRSLNGRFQQRMWNPNVDIVSADWSPLSQSSYLMPLLSELSPWRKKFEEIEDALDNQTTVVFVADFPGLYLENFVGPNLGNTSIQVLKGIVQVEITGKKNVTLHEGHSVQVPPGKFHIVRTISDTPSCYMYLTVNTTDVAIKKKFNNYKEMRNNNHSKLSEFSSEELKIFNDLLEDEKFIEEYMNMTLLDRLKDFYQTKWSLFSSSFYGAFQAVHNIVTSASGKKVW